jgi:hypothetical protein
LERHWTPKELVPSEVELWRPPVDVERVGSIILPLHRTAGDYWARIRDALVLIAQWEKRPPELVVEEVRGTLHDVFRFARTGSDVDGSIGLRDGRDLLTAVESVLRSAAVSAVFPTRVLPSNLPAQAAAFLDDVRLGQTEVGSYVITIIAPLGTLQPDEGELVAREDAPFSRDVGVALGSSLASTRSALDEAHQKQDITGFSRRVGNGVTANLLEALAKPLEDATDAGLRISISWSRARPPAADVPSIVEFHRSDRGVLLDAASVLRDEPDEKPISITGLVTRLESDEPDSHGTIGLTAGGRKYTLQGLTPDDYRKATRAHLNGLNVAVEGRVERHGNYSYLRDASSLEIIEGVDFDSD